MTPRGHPTESPIQQLCEHLAMEEKGGGQNNREIQSDAQPGPTWTRHTPHAQVPKRVFLPWRLVQGPAESGRIKSLIRLGRLLLPPLDNINEFLEQKVCSRFFLQRWTNIFLLDNLRQRSRFLGSKDADTLLFGSVIF